MESELKSLPSDTVRLIGSSQVITSVYSVVKELVENALDSGASSVDIKLENYGLDKVEIRDNGYGIKESNMEYVAKRYHTSKIASFSDLELLATYGFRGEALGSLCAVSSLSITSKTSEEPVSFTYSFDHHGNIVARQPSHLGQGTTVASSQLFKNLPVRRQFYNTVKKKKEELKRIEDLIMAYGAIKPGVRFVLKHGKDTVWQKNVLSDTRSVLLGIMGRNVMTQLQHDMVKCENSKTDVEYFFPGPKSNPSLTSRSTNDRCFIAVNERPVQVKEIEKLVKQHYCSCMGIDGRYPVFFLSLKISTCNLDVNVDPNKTRVMLHDQKSILSEISRILEAVYGPLKDKRDDGDKNKDTSIEDSPTNKSASSLNDSDSFSNDSDLKYGGEKNIFSTKGHVIRYKANANSHADVLIDVDSVKPISEHKSECSAELTNLDSVQKILITEHTVLHKNQTSAKGQNEKENNKEIVEANGNETESVRNGIREKEIQSSLRNANMDVETCLSTQREQISFNFLDPDLEELLKSQNESSKPSAGTSNNSNLDVIPAELFSSFSEEESINNNIGKSNVLQSNKENTETAIQSESYPLTDMTKTTDSVNSINMKEGVNTDHTGFSNKLMYDSSEAVDWTTGKGAIGSDGRILQPVTLLAPNNVSSSNKRPLLDSDIAAFTPPLKRKSLNVEVNQPRLYDVVGKSPKEKYSLGFTAFSREERPKVVEENPDLSYDEITKLVGKKWERLDEMDKKQFEDQGKVQVEILKKKVQEKQRTTPKLSKKIEQPVSIKDKMLSTSKLSTNLPPIQTVKVKFSLQRLTDLYHGELRHSQSSSDTKMSLVGSLKFYNGWICYHGNKLNVINPHRVEETILFQELMENHVISCTKLENPIRLDESNLGQSLVQVLVQMIPDDSCQTYVYIDDPCMMSNGFKIRCHVDENNCPILELDSLCKSIPTYGVTDLKEVLQLIKDTSASSLKQCRPLKVIYYLQGEAVRMVRQRPLMRSKEDMVDILEQMVSSLPKDCVNCLHDKPFLHSIFDMNDIPSSQLTQSEWKLVMNLAMMEISYWTRLLYSRRQGDWLAISLKYQKLSKYSYLWDPLQITSIHKMKIFFIDIFGNVNAS